MILNNVIRTASFLGRMTVRGAEAVAPFAQQTARVVVRETRKEIAKAKVQQTIESAKFNEVVDHAKTTLKESTAKYKADVKADKAELTDLQKQWLVDAGLVVSVPTKGRRAQK